MISPLQHPPAVTIVRQTETDLAARVAELERDLASARTRNHTLIRELTRAAAAPTIVSVLKGPDRECDEIVFLSNGVKLLHRWSAKDASWHYVQAECLPGTLAAIVDGVFTSAADERRPVAGMAVVGDDDTAEAFA